MIRGDGKTVVHLPTIDYGENDGGPEVISVHDTYDGASNALKERGFRPAGLFTIHGEIYACKGKTADDYPYGYIDDVDIDEVDIDDVEVRP